MRATGKALIGSSQTQLLKPADLKLIISSPRKRATQTKDLLLENIPESELSHVEVQIDEDIREWEYGEYEGLLTADIKRLDPAGEDWNIWEHGTTAAGGEDWKQVTARIDHLIAKIRSVHKVALEKNQPCDVVVIAHGHILRCFAARWVGYPINTNPKYMLDAGGVGVLSYQHHNIEEPALYLAGAFVPPDEEVSAGL
ncbi:unnamed protein product [Ambrosiozyma monospora]|uniref:Unnamed protein product n=1 Tax=Ambrosiozyma monospora TaxID=43982 RepID=A0A9W6YYK9_AMBMO|nr:unnamed protein product [Ambrosiozyma monospora]